MLPIKGTNAFETSVVEYSVVVVLDIKKELWLNVDLFVGYGPEDQRSEMLEPRAWILFEYRSLCILLNRLSPQFFLDKVECKKTVQCPFFQILFIWLTSPPSAQKRRSHWSEQTTWVVARKSVLRFVRQDRNLLRFKLDVIIRRDKHNKCILYYLYKVLYIINYIKRFIYVFIFDIIRSKNYKRYLSRLINVISEIVLNFKSSSPAIIPII